MLCDIISYWYIKWNLKTDDITLCSAQQKLEIFSLAYINITYHENARVTYTNIATTCVHWTNLKSHYIYSNRNAGHSCQVSVHFQKERTDIKFQMRQEDDLMTLHCNFLDGLMVTSGMSEKPLPWRLTPTWWEKAASIESILYYFFFLLLLLHTSILMHSTHKRYHTFM